MLLDVNVPVDILCYVGGVMGVFKKVSKKGRKFPRLICPKGYICKESVQLDMFGLNNFMFDLSTGRFCHVQQKEDVQES